ncbi:hypothetical protein CBEVV_015 [Choristoneura biennis entomopoxvirus 'L' virophage]|nr:hypothetical protein CBEVV_015 [Choristoneura biennis entomopoxvirus 'L' virophage]
MEQKSEILKKGVGNGVFVWFFAMLVWFYSFISCNMLGKLRGWSRTGGMFLVSTSDND